MEFIPLERYSKRTKNKESEEKQKVVKSKKITEDEVSERVTVEKVKSKGPTKVFQKKNVMKNVKKNVKNKYKETLALKQKQKKRVPKKKTQKKKEEEEEDEDEEEEVEEEEDEKEETMEVEDEEDEDSQNEDEDEEQKKRDEEAFKRKCQEMDEKKKNRLFVKLKKKILNKSQILELHPDIKDVIFPRKKKSMWCWAVFTSEEKANKAMKALIKNKEVLVNKPTPYNEVDKKRKEKMKAILRKKDASKKLQKMWM